LENLVSKNENLVESSYDLGLDTKADQFGFTVGTIARRLSIHRATTVGQKSGLCQVIIKNTNAFKNIPHSSSSTSINRSQSLLSTNRIPVLAPPRAERIRLESLLADVWTRDILPYPGMTSRVRSEHMVRASASSMIRKLSVASITSNFTKRSSSMNSLPKPGDDVPTETETSHPSVFRPDHNLMEAAPWVDYEDLLKSRLSVIQDEKENFQQDHFEIPSTLQGGPNSSPVSSVGTIRRLATLKGKQSWVRDGQRIITPPLRASSANSITQHRTATPPLVHLQGEAKENLPQVKPVQMVQEVQKGGKRIGKNRAVAEGIRNFFR